MSTEDDLRELLAERDIRRVLHRYCHAIDRCDADELLDVFHPDAVDDHGGFSGPDGHPVPMAEYVPWVMDLLRHGAEATTHQISNIKIELRLADDAAYVETYIMASHVHRNDDGSRRLDTLSGRYIDRFERRQERWRIAHRRLVVDWDKTEPLREAYAEDVFVRGRRAQDDLSYRP